MVGFLEHAILSIFRYDVRPNGFKFAWEYDTLNKFDDLVASGCRSKRRVCYGEYSAQLRRQCGVRDRQALGRCYADPRSVLLARGARLGTGDGTRFVCR